MWAIAYGGFQEVHTKCFVSGVLGATHVEIEQHLEMGRKLLAAGQLAEALSHYHSAVGKVTNQTHIIIALTSLDVCL